jgi:hypothetical protein
MAIKQRRNYLRWPACYPPPAERRRRTHAQTLVALRRLIGERYAITSADLVKAINGGDANALTVLSCLWPGSKPEWPVTSRNVAASLAAYARDKPVRCGPLVLGLKVFKEGSINRYRVVTAVAGAPVQLLTPAPVYHVGTAARGDNALVIWSCTPVGHPGRGV